MNERFSSLISESQASGETQTHSLSINSLYWGIEKGGFVCGINGVFTCISVFIFTRVIIGTYLGP